MTPNDYAEACERAAAICYLTVGPPEYRSEMAERMVTDADKLRILATALRQVPADHVRMGNYSLVVIALPDPITLPTEPI